MFGDYCGVDYGSFWDKDDAAFFGKNGELSVKRDYINGLRLEERF